MYEALKSFCGKVSMRKGEIKKIDNINIANDLVNVGYIKKIIDKKQVDVQVDVQVNAQVDEKLGEKEIVQEINQETTQEKVKKTRNSKKKK